MKPFKLEIEINKVVFSKTFKFDFSFIEFVNTLDVKHSTVKLETVDECECFIRKYTAYKIVDFEKEDEVFNTISNALNSGLDIKKLIQCHTTDHKTIQQKFTTLCLSWIEKVGSSTYGFDGRNEFSHEQCEKIVHFMQTNNIYSGMPLI